ncbi:MAG: DUF6020 family protein [Roseburia sp.]
MNLCYFVILCLLCLNTKRLWNRGRRRKLFAGLFGILLSCGYVFGYWIQKRQYVFAGEESVKIILITLLLSIPLANLFDLLCEGIGRGKEAAEPKITKRRFSILIFVLLLFAWIPVWLAFYPCIYAYDAMMQTHYCIEQGLWTNQQPLLHTMLLGIFWELAKLFGGNLASGMAMYAFFQMLALDGALTYALTWLYEKRVRGIRWMVLWCAFFPVHPMLAISITKDTLFAAISLVLVVYQFKCMEKKPKPWSVMGITLLAAIALLLRNNAIYALALAAVLSLLILRGRERKLYVLVAVAATCIFTVGKYGMMEGTGAAPSPTVESLCVPLQQMARVGKYADAGAVRAYISEDAIWAYNEVIADPVKWTVMDRGIDDVGAFLRTWVSVGIRYTRLYLDAFLANTAGYWYPDDTLTVQRLYYLQTASINPGDGICDIEITSKLPFLYERLCQWFGNSNQYTENVVLSFFCNIPVYTWLLIFYFFYMVYKKKWRLLLPVMFLGAYFLTLLLGPCVLVRYAYLIMVAAPVLIGILMITGKDEENNGQNCSSDSVLQ